MMNCELSATPEAVIEAEVAVVGSGLAGAEVATYLAGRGRRVVLLESGRETFDPAIQSLHDAEIVGRPHREYTAGADFHDYLPPEYRGRNRLRQLGGTSCSWTGKWRAFEPRDFAGRPWIPLATWPVGFDEMRPAYAEVARDYGLMGGVGDQLEGALAQDGAAFVSAGFKVVPFAQNPSPLRTAEALLAARSPGLEILLDATVTRIDLAEGADRVAALLCRSIGGAERRVEARHVVLATGGFETPRLLLASNHQHPEGLGNGADLVGRFYQDHLKIKRARLAPGPLVARHASAFQTLPRPRVMLSLGLPNARQEALGLLDATLFFRPVHRRGLARLGDAVLRRSPARDGIGPIDHYVVTFALEQAPNRESRVRLASGRDALGQPRLAIDWRLSPLDRHSFDVSARELARAARASGLGALDYGANPADIEKATDAAHHMGTTRMAATPREGVVDPDCTVFGIPNLHIASSSVFPTGNAYSPTFTIVALARRLAKRLDADLGRALVVPGPARRSA